MNRARTTAIAIGAALALGVAACAPPVPDQSLTTYRALESTLTAHPAEPVPVPDPTVFGTELLLANSNRGEALLAPATLTAIDVFLAAVADLHVGGLTVQVSYPLLDPTFPRSAEYLAFYREVLQRIRARGLLVVVETGPVFANSPYSDLDVDYSNLDSASYLAARRGDVVRAAHELRPDYLSIGNEPSTETLFTGIAFTDDEYASFVHDTASAIAPEPGVRVGAGTGTWESSGLYARFAGDAELDFLGVHVYPVATFAGDQLDRADAMATLAQTRGKETVLGETWLYKATPAELAAGIASDAIYRRDVFDYWRPLDQRFMEAIAALARRHEATYASAFFSTYLFGQLRWSAALEALPHRALMQQVNQAAFAAMVASTPSPLGVAYRNVIDTGRATP